MSRKRQLILAVLALLPVVARSQQADRHPLDYPLQQYAFILGVALLGGLVSWYAKVRAGRLHGWNLMHLIGELATSAFAGLLAFWLCAWAGANPLVTAALVGIAGHMGARAIAVFEDWAQRKFGEQVDRRKTAE
jgi:CHASE2 domain-containing sensor protein